MPEMDRRTVIWGAVALVSVIIVAWLLISALGGFSSMKRRVTSAKAELASFESLGTDYLSKRSAVDAVARRAVVTGSPVSAVEIIEDLVRGVGVSGGVASMKPAGERTIDGYTERTVEFTIERVDLNQLINLMYMIDNGRALLVVREFSMKNRFEQPDLLDVTIRLSHLVRLPV